MQGEILLISPKDADATQRLISEARKMSIRLLAKDVHELAKYNFQIDINQFEVLYVRQAYPYFEEVLQLARQFVKAGKRVVDKVLSEDSNLDFGKMEDLKILAENHLPIPKTQWLKDVKDIKYPFQLKWNYGFGGHNVFYVEKQPDLDKLISQHPQEQWLWQEHIVAEWEYKVMTIGFKVLPKILKFPVSHASHRPDFGHVHVIEASQNSEISKLAEESTKLLRKELAKVDIVQQGNRYVILEVNRWPGLRIYEDLTQVNIASLYFAYLKGNLHKNVD